MDKHSSLFCRIISDEEKEFNELAPAILVGQGDVLPHGRAPHHEDVREGQAHGGRHLAQDIAPLRTGNNPIKHFFSSSSGFREKAMPYGCIIENCGHN
jgi:hypothetical protein